MPKHIKRQNGGRNETIIYETDRLTMVYLIKELEKMMKNAPDEKTKAIISELLMKYQ